MTVAALVPADADLSDFRFMPLEVTRLCRSKAWLICKRLPELAFYIINLFAAAWHERPAGSLAAMCPPEVRADVMRGWFKAADGGGSRWVSDWLIGRGREIQSAVPAPDRQVAQERGRCGADGRVMGHTLAIMTPPPLRGTSPRRAGRNQKSTSWNDKSALQQHRVLGREGDRHRRALVEQVDRRPADDQAADRIRRCIGRSRHGTCVGAPCRAAGCRPDAARGRYRRCAPPPPSPPRPRRRRRAGSCRPRSRTCRDRSRRPSIRFAEPTKSATKRLCGRL